MQSFTFTRIPVQFIEQRRLAMIAALVALIALFASTMTLLVAASYTNTLGPLTQPLVPPQSKFVCHGRDDKGRAVQVTLPEHSPEAGYFTNNSDFVCLRGESTKARGPARHWFTFRVYQGYRALTESRVETVYLDP